MKHYFIFGSAPSRAYWDNDQDVSKIMDEINYDGCIHMYDTERDSLQSLLLEYDGWGGFVEITEQEYNYIQENL